MKPKVIVTGFEPFSVYPINSSWQAAKLLANEEANTLVKELKVNHAEAHYQLLALLKENKADVLLLSGLADRDQIAVETKACKPVALHFVDGPDVLYGRWPWKESLTALERFACTVWRLRKCREIRL